MPRCRIDFFGDVDGDGSVNWLDGAKSIRQRMPAIPTHYFDDKLLYLIGGKYKLEKEPRTTFAQSEQLIHEVAMLTDYAPQVVLIGGWEYDGQDTGYPAEDKVNDMGGYDGLMHLIDSGQAFNANVSLNTNYDDASMSSRMECRDHRAASRRRALEEPRLGWRNIVYRRYGEIHARAGSRASGPRQKRAHHLRDAILVDALSWYAIRNDWDPENPASGYKNPVDGRYKLIDEFRKRGVNVLSEQLRYPYLGKLALSVDGVSGGDDPFGGQPIPLLPTLYRQSAIWAAEELP